MRSSGLMEAAMDDIPILDPARPRAAWPAMLRRTLATWCRRMRLRRELARKLKGDPHLIDDIGLTRRQVEDEIAKPFWRPDLTEAAR